jgi:phage tail sheath protein FI
MALDYFAPGVYVEEVDRGSRPIEGVSMSVAGFIGFTEDVRGDAELFKPMLITNWGQYLESFAKEGSDGFTDFDAYLPFAIQGWFLNGGGRCWVTSIGTRLPGSEAPPIEETGTKLLTAGKKPSLHFTLKAAESEGGALALPGDAGRIKVIITDSTPKPLPEDAPEDTEPPLNTGEFFSLIVTQGDEELERYDHLSMNPEVETAVADYVITALEESTLINVINISQTGQALSRRPANGLMEVAPPPHISHPDRFSRELQGQRDDRTGTQGLFEVDEVAMIACPDLMRVYQEGLMDLDQVHGVMEMMISLCENSFPGPAYRMAVIDPPPVKPGKGTNPVAPEQQKPQDVAQWLKEFNRRSMFGALYYPWIKVANPRNGGKPIYVPPCGHMMGIWCRTDESRGVFKAPANETPRGVIGLAYDTNMREQELLNPMGVNCIRNFANYNRGYKVWGARTLVEPDNVQWRYISVRRLLSYIEKSIEIGTQWVVFEPNDQILWARVRRTVSSFLERLWREGALFGASPSESFYVKCDAEINTPDTMMLGRLYVEIGVCPVRPAEFVIFRISQWSPNQ